MPNLPSRGPLAWAAALAAGLCQPLGLAPFNLWPVSLLGLIGFFALLIRPKAQLAALAFAFAVGMYGLGVSWVYVSINTFGQAPVLLALLLTGLWVTFLALVFALPYGLWQRRLPGPLPLWALPPLWLLGEWLRSWLFTGFPWLYAGYGHLTSPLAGWAPVLGIFGLGLIIATTAALALALWQRQPGRWLALAGVAGLWGAGAALQQVAWTTPAGPVRTVAMVQPNIPQQHKWDPDWLMPTYDRLLTQSKALWGHNWLVWPEAALPTLMSEAQPFMARQAEVARESDTSLVTGVIVNEPHVIERDGRRLLGQRYYNSLVVLGMGQGVYHKQRLVPFGEYVPFDQQLRGVIEFFDLPMSVLHRGPANQQPLMLGHTPVWPAVCYEIVYPDLIAAGARRAEAILTVSNDAWFGRSIAPIQHLQMAQMRALETRRPVVRATNNGFSAIINARGEITAQAPQFELTSLSGSLLPARGNTPYMLTGSWPVVCLSLLALTLLIWRAKRARP
ncbi:apolipoprotein N-acyltransferase [Simiduia sp. 21SJ11W-1]|uniref:apolipoprotein N-acyltransferase n=1 Tax=Simiduia sp. 21SJ11W-1 TaxID=2909669 RepID=UPI00209E4D27|nr:apolipoprotein N-acyltransferase [Simiduia sp. 21SJ11W-1]UTA48765.1 apolipoprotein N-acyltransferase [Simiduia sp. 21SJ11W-1]